MTAIIFPGQGSQYIGMAKEFFDNFEQSKLAFEEIETYTGLNLRKIIFEDPDNLLNLTNYTQISIFTASIAIYKSIESNFFNISNSPKIMFGHSLGEYTALASSKILNLKDCSTILRHRSNLMHTTVNPNETGMAALIGLNSELINKIILEHKIKIEIANDNSPIQVVISGLIDEITKSIPIFEKTGVKKIIKLNVSAAFHSKFMFSAQEKLNKIIDDVNFNDSKIKIISNYNAELNIDKHLVKNALKKQMSNKVRWTESVKKLESSGEKKILEIGPGKVLSGLIKRISNIFDIISIDKLTDLDNLK